MSEKKKEFWLYKSLPGVYHVQREAPEFGLERTTHVIDMESYRRLEAAYKVLREALEKIDYLTAYAGTPSKEIAEYLIKQAGIKSKVISKEALQKAEEILK